MEKKIINLGTTYSKDFAFEANTTAYEDDHGLVIDMEGLGHLRIEPSNFPALIALMAETMEGMVNF